MCVCVCVWGEEEEGPSGSVDRDNSRLLQSIRFFVENIDELPKVRDRSGEKRRVE